MKAIITGIEAKTLTPFNYHSLMVQGGTATLPELISDAAIAFGLASTLGMMNARVALPKKDYLRDWRAMPWRTSIFTTDQPELLPPVIRRLNLTDEAGYAEKLQNLTKRGNFKDFFSTQEVPANVYFSGAIFGFNPFQDGKKELVIRIGLHRNGMVRLRPKLIKEVCLNAATAHLFERELTVNRYLLHGLQLTRAISVKDALKEVQQWH